MRDFLVLSHITRSACTVMMNEPENEIECKFPERWNFVVSAFIFLGFTNAPTSPMDLQSVASPQ
jgi:hypothetical protein